MWHLHDCLSRFRKRIPWIQRKSKLCNCFSQALMSLRFWNRLRKEPDKSGVLLGKAVLKRKCDRTHSTDFAAQQHSRGSTSRGTDQARPSCRLQCMADISQRKFHFIRLRAVSLFLKVGGKERKTSTVSVTWERRSREPLVAWAFREERVSQGPRY